MFSGIPRYNITSVSPSIASCLPSFPAARIAKYPRVYSSNCVTVRSINLPQQRHDLLRLVFSALGRVVEMSRIHDTAMKRLWSFLGAAFAGNIRTLCVVAV